MRLHVFVEVLARVRGDPSGGHGPPIHKGDPPPHRPLYPPSKVRHKELAGLFSHVPKVSSLSFVPDDEENASHTHHCSKVRSHADNSHTFIYQINLKSSQDVDEVINNDVYSKY